MSKKNAANTAKTLIEVLGGKSNIASYTNCMTRLRVKVNDVSKVDEKKLKITENVMGLVKSDNEMQIILGPGFVRQVREEINKIIPDISSDKEVDESLDKSNLSLAEVSQINKKEQKLKNVSSVQLFLAKFAKIFAPLIPAFIGAGILAGLAGLMQGFYQQIDPLDPSITFWTNQVAYSWYQTFNMMLTIWKDAFIIIVGWRTAEAFGGEGIFGALASLMFVGAFAGTYTAPFINQGADGFLFLGIKIKDPMTNWLTIGFRPGEIIDPITGDVTGYTLAGSTGGVIGAMIMAGMSVPIVKKMRQFTPGVLDLLLASTFSIVAMIFASYFIVIPISGMLFTFISFLFENLAGNPFGAAVLASLFLIALVFGVHQGFIPVYTALLASTGVNSLFAVLAMGGAGQVGASLALYFKADKDSVIRKQIRGAIIPGFLGIGEPLVYGISLTRPKVFLSASLGAAVAGFFIGAVSSWGGVTIGLNTVFGPAGLSCLPLMIASKGGVVGYNLMAMGIYLISLIIAWVSGFGFVHLIGTKGVDLS